MLTDFQNSFADRLGDKFATKNIPTRLKYVATLPCEIWTSENWRQSEICIAINDKSQGSRPIAKHLSWDVLLNYKFTIQFAGEIIFKIGENLAKLQAKWLIVCHTPHSPYTFVLKNAELAR